MQGARGIVMSAVVAVLPALTTVLAELYLLLYD